MGSSALVVASASRIVDLRSAPGVASRQLLGRGRGPRVGGGSSGPLTSSRLRARVTVWAPRRALPRHSVRPHHTRRTTTAPTDSAMATAEVDRERTVSWPSASTRLPSGLVSCTSIWKSPEVRDCMLTYTALVEWVSVHSAEKLDRSGELCTCGARHSAPGTWVPALGNRSLSLVSRTTTVTGYGVLRRTVMGTLAVPAVRRMVSERTDRPWSWRAKADSKPDQGRLLLAGREQARLGGQEEVADGLDRGAPRRAPGHRAPQAAPGGPAPCAGRGHRAGAGAAGASGCRVTGWPSAPTGTWAKSWSRVTGWITGLPCSPARSGGDEGGVRCPRRGSHGHHAPRAPGCRPGPGGWGPRSR